MIILEACVENLKEALLAEENGATQIELCADLAHDGTTPDVELIKEVLARVKIPVKVMIRPRAGNFVYTLREMEEMVKSISICKDLNVKGVVFGILDENDELNTSAIQELTHFSSPLEVTIHKAIDLTPDLVTAVRELKSIKGISSILSSGGSARALEGAPVLNKMVEEAEGRIEIIAAGKVTRENLSEVQHSIKTTAFHGRKIVGRLSISHLPQQ